MKTQETGVQSRDGESHKKQLLRRKTALWNERSSWIAHWQDISDYLLPRSGRFLTTNTNDGGKRHNNIIDSTGTRSLRVLAAGMMSGMTSPARPWFRLTIGDSDLMEYDPVRQWLDDVSKLMREVFARSNTYRSLHMMYEELGAFNTAANIITPDFEDVILNHPLTVGEYAIATNERGIVDTLFREVPMTVDQMIRTFGKENVSLNVRNQYDRGNLDGWHTVIHAIEPRASREYGKRDAKNMPYRSCYFELAGEGDKLLREGGFKRFPGLAPRWSVSGGDIYGHGPGQESLGDLKQLQHQQLRKATAIDYMTRPPLQGPSILKNQEVDSLPGGMSYVDSINPGSGIRAQFEVNLNLQHLLADIQDVRERVKGTFYADLFLMLANDTRSGITATEVAERHEEKLLMLGPVLERLHNEMLAPLVDLTFDRLVEANVLPEPPQELQGANLNVQFVSTLAQAQRAIGVQSVDRWLGTVSSLAAVKPEVLDKIDGDKIVDEYADMLGIDPDLIVADDKVAIIRQQRAAQMQQQQAMAMMQPAADAVNKLAGADTEGANALTQILQGVQGYSTPGVTR